MKEIHLTKGQTAFVDDEDFELVNSYKWIAQPYCKSFRAIRRKCPTINGKWKKFSCSMHRFILCAEDGKIVDHIDGNPLNNQRSNLRICDLSGNNSNTSSRVGSSSRFLGVTKQGNTWRAQIRKNKKLYFLGVYNDEIQAAFTYNIAACVIHGAFGRLNRI